MKIDMRIVWMLSAALFIPIAALALVSWLFILQSPHPAAKVVKFIGFAVMGAVAIFGLVKYVQWAWYF